MVYVSMLEMLREAQRKRYAVGYFESWNLESTQAVIKAAEEERSPVIIGFGGALLATRKHELEYYASIGKVAVKNIVVPADLLLNEPSGFQQIVQGIRHGFSSVMIDGSFLPFKENIKLTKKVVEVAHSVGACVEGQLDALPRAKDGFLLGDIKKACMTDPKKAAEFVNETGIDALSVSIGNIHLSRQEVAKINFNNLKEIRELVDIPLVIHGATSVSDDSIKKAIRLGICKVNIGTRLRLAFTNGIRKALDKSPLIDPEEILESAELEMKKLVKNKMRVYGSAAKAES